MIFQRAVLLMATMVVVMPHFAAGEPAGRVLWSAGHEQGNLANWTDQSFQYPGGGIFNTGDSDVSATASTDVAHSGRWSAKTVIHNAIRAQNGNRAVRLMRWTNRAWDDGGHYLPDEACYSVWVYFPERYNPNKKPPWDPGDGGWWNIFQFKSEDHDGEIQPAWTLNVGFDEAQERMYLYLYSKYNSPSSYEQEIPLAVPIRRWVHIEAYLQSATGCNGQICIWQDDRKIFDIDHVVTSLGGKTGSDTHPIWGIGNYTDHISGDPAGVGTATLYFDDAAIRSGSHRSATDASSD